MALTLQLLAFETAEMHLAVTGENLADGEAGTGFDGLVEVDELHAAPLADGTAEGGLAATHETGQEKRAVKGGGRLYC